LRLNIEIIQLGIFLKSLKTTVSKVIGSEQNTAVKFTGENYSCLTPI